MVDNSYEYGPQRPRSLKTGSQAWHGTETFITFRLEENLTPEFLVVLIEPGPELSLSPIDLPSLKLDCNRFIRFSGNDEILIIVVGLLHFLLESAHEAYSGYGIRRNVGELELEENAILTSCWIANFGDSVSRSADFDDVLLHLHSRQQTLLTSVILFALPLFFRGTPSEIGLMLPSLSVCEI